MILVHGSFTGIRIGIATVKAFYDSFGIPTVGVSSLEVLAYNVKMSGLIICMIDCKNNNCYFAIYELNNNIYSCLQTPEFSSIDNVLDLIKYKYFDKSITFIGNASFIYQDKIFDNLPDLSIATASEDLNNINIYNLGLAGIRHYKDSNYKYEPLLPLYLKKPQAQTQLEEKNLNISLMTSSNLKNIQISDFDEFWNISNLSDELNSENSKLIIAKYDNKIVGFAGVKIIFDNAELMNIAVHKNFRKQGVGKLLLSELIDICRKNSVKIMHLEVNEDNFSAINLYKKFNFKIVGKRAKYYDNKDAILMDLNIAP